jgi:hypothetical protein
MYIEEQSSDKKRLEDLINKDPYPFHSHRKFEYSTPWESKVKSW